MSLTDFLQMPLTILAILRVSLITFKKGNERQNNERKCHILGKIIMCYYHLIFACGS